MRSLLFVPADSPRKLEKAWGSGADALIIDLEDSVAASAKENARRSAADYLRHADRGTNAPKLIVRVNALDTGLTDADLDAIVPHAPFAIMLPKGVNTAWMDTAMLSRQTCMFKCRRHGIQGNADHDGPFVEPWTHTWFPRFVGSNSSKIHTACTLGF